MFSSSRNYVPEHDEDDSGGEERDFFNQLQHNPLQLEENECADQPSPYLEDLATPFYKRKFTKAIRKSSLLAPVRVSMDEKDYQLFQADDPIKERTAADINISTLQMKKNNSNEVMPLGSKCKLKALNESGSGEDISGSEHNPITKLLRSKIGPQFDSESFMSKNAKMVHNLQMLDGFAMCTENNEYERTYLDKIKIQPEFLD